MTEIQNGITFTRSDFGSLTHAFVVFAGCSDFIPRVSTKSAVRIIFSVLRKRAQPLECVNVHCFRMYSIVNGKQAVPFILLVTLIQNNINNNRIYM